MTRLLTQRLLCPVPSCGALPPCNHHALLQQYCVRLAWPTLLMTGRLLHTQAAAGLAVFSGRFWEAMG